MKLASLFLASFMVCGTLTYGAYNIIRTDSAHAQEAIVEVVQAADPIIAQAAAASPEVVQEMPKLCKDDAGVEKACENEDFLKFLVASVGGAQGLTTLGIVFLIVKGIMFLLLTPIGIEALPFLAKGYWRLTAVLVLNLVGGVIGLSLADVALSAALVHSSTLAAFSLLGNQLVKQFLTKKDSLLQAA